MSKSRLKLTLIIFIMIVSVGIVKVNYELNKRSSKEAAAEIYNGDGESTADSYDFDLYNEIVLSRNSDRKLKIFFRANPFDLSLNVGNNIMYINKKAYNNIVEGKNKIINNFVDNMTDGIKNIKDKLKCF